MLNKWKILPLLAAAVLFASANVSPVFAAGMYDDNGNYIEYYDDRYDEEEEFDEDYDVEAFNTAWFIDHPGKDVYVINTSSQLQGLADLVNNGRYNGYEANHYEDFEGITIRLGQDIHLREDYVPIGRSDEVAFRGTFDGAGHAVSGLRINENGGNAGLFGYLDGTVRNLTLEGTVESSGPVCGGIAGYVSPKGRILNCASRAEVSGKAKTGGIAGYNDGGTIAGCINAGNVKGTMKVGGVVGENWGSVKKCGNRGEVRSSVRGATTYGTGGVCGRSVSAASSIDRCFNAGHIISGTEGTGGVCGYMNARGSRIVRSCNTGSLSIHNNAVINTNSIRGYAGGIVGIAGVKGIVIRNCYNAGAISNSDVSGGIIGCYLNESETEDEPDITNNYYLNTAGLKGVGRDYEGKSRNYGEGTEKISQAALMNGAVRLGSAYMDDTQNDYGCDGFPALKWQKKVGKVENTRLQCMPEELQERYDRYLRKHSGAAREDWTIMMFFHNSSFASKAIGDYHEK